jgi:sec-independent protein translocase protein TatB
MFPEERFVEILIIGALALIVIGPKDLPILMRRLGRFIGKMRAMAAEFRASFDELARQSELDELRKEVEALRQSQTSIDPPHSPIGDPPANTALDAVDAAPPPIEPPSPAVEAEPAPKSARKPRAKAARTMGEAP